MDFESYVERRKKRYMAQLLEEFEREIEPHVSAGASQAFKALVRRKLNSFSNDVIDLLKLDGTERNGSAIDLEDRLFPNGRTR